MRCVFCGVEGGAGTRLATGPGVAICAGCAAAAATVTGPPPAGWEAPARPGWDRDGTVDPGALAALPVAALQAEALVVWEVGAPLRHFLDAVRGLLGGCSGHRDPVTLADGTVVWAASFDEAAPYDRDEPPDFGLYLDPRWSPPWPHAHVDWPDFAVPADGAAATAALADLLGRARRGERVEVGCLGGHGRTGTALAVLAVLAGTPDEEVVDWVRSAYCARAIETDEQAAFVAATRR
ncbi:MAG TPA: protein-tyrosine phosphatase family protein [Acidimicrobiales bacterium]|nr:protein-tyrosine phosphatase family protein [Acidimicrobiales bacterium]